MAKADAGRAIALAPIIRSKLRDTRGCYECIPDAVRNTDAAIGITHQKQISMTNACLFDGLHAVNMSDFVLRHRFGPAMYAGGLRGDVHPKNLAEFATYDLHQFGIVFLETGDQERA